MISRALHDQMVDNLASGPCPVPPAARRARLSTWLEEQQLRMKDALRAHRLARACQREIPVASWLPQLLHASRRPTVLTAPDIDADGQIVVDLLAWSEPLDGARTWAETRRRVRAAWNHVDPKSLRVRLPATQTPRVGPAERRIDATLFAEKLSILRTRGRPWGEAAMEIRQGGSLDTARYVDAYARWSTQATLGQRVPQTDALRGEDVRMVHAYFDGRWAGVAAATPDADRVLDGYRVVDLMLDEPYRGRRKAHVLLRALTDSLVDHGREVLWAFVPGWNHPARHSLLRLGLAAHEHRWLVRL